MHVEDLFIYNCRRELYYFLYDWWIYYTVEFRSLHSCCPNTYNLSLSFLAISFNPRKPKLGSLLYCTNVKWERMVLTFISFITFSKSAGYIHSICWHF